MPRPVRTRCGKFTIWLSSATSELIVTCVAESGRTHRRSLNLKEKVLCLSESSSGRAQSYQAERGSGKDEWLEGKTSEYLFNGRGQKY